MDGGVRGGGAAAPTHDLSTPGSERLRAEKVMGVGHVGLSMEQQRQQSQDKEKLDRAESWRTPS